MFLPSTFSKCRLLNLGKSRHCWLPLLPTELRIELLLTIGAQHNSIDSVMILAREFPEFGELVLVLHWTGGSLLDVSRTNIKVVALNEYASFPKKQSSDRPVRIIIKDFTDPLIHHFPSHKLDGSPSCLLNRFVTPRTMVELQTLSVHSSVLLLNHSQAPLAQYTVDSSQHPPSNLRLDYEQLQTHAGGCRSREIFHADPYFTLTPAPSREELLDEAHWRLNHPSYNGDSSFRLKSLVVYNCPAIFNLDFGSGVEVVEIKFSSRRDHMTHPSLVLLSSYPTHVLHVTFNSWNIPMFQDSGPFISSRYLNRSGFVDLTFTLQNANWNHTNPYGLNCNVPADNFGFPVGVLDQATYNRAIAEGLQERLGHNSVLELPLCRFKTVKLYGVPDTTVVVNSFANVVCLYWWRLTPRVAGLDDDTPQHIIHCPSLKELHIISVIKGNETPPIFQAPRLSELVLISLHDSEVAWSLQDTLIGDAPNLTKVYIERRTDPSRDLALPMAIRSDELGKVTPTVETLHLRGYIPNVFMIGHNQPRYIFYNLRILILDLSELSKIARTSPSIEPESTIVTLAFEQPGFPVLESLNLMCTQEAYLANELSSINLRLLVCPSCVEVYISDCINLLSIQLNGQPLVMDESQYLAYKTATLSGSRMCQFWYSEFGSSGSFKYCGQMIFTDLVTCIRDY